MKNGKKGGHGASEITHIVYISFIILLIAVFYSVIYKEGAIGSVNATVIEILDNSITIIISIICSIIASIIYAHIMKKMTEEEKEAFKEDIKQISNEIYDEKIDDGVQRISQSVLKIYSGLTDMMPSHYYRSADSPNLEFNNFLNRKIMESRRFIYYGESPRFTCKRLYQLKDENPALKNLKIEVFIANPACDKLFESNKAFLIAKEKNGNYGCPKELETIIKAEKIKILYCLYALTHIMSSFQQIDIFLINDVPFMDIEMTDDMVALEFFRTRKDYKRYPLTLIFEGKRVYYESYEFYLEWEREKAIHIKEENLTVDYIIDLAKKAGIEKLTEERLKEYCNKKIFNESEKYI